MNILAQITEIILTNRRHKRYQQQIALANIKRVPATKTMGTPIRSANEVDHSHSFKPW